MANISREEVLAANPLIPFLERRGIKLRGNGDKRSGTQCAALSHKKDHWCVTVDGRMELWHCNDCGQGGTVIDWIMIEGNKTVKEVMSELAAPLNGQENNKDRAVLPKIVATYDYTNEQSELVYQVVRMEPKSFRQRQKMASGEWQWNMEGITRILYRLPEVLLAQVVVCCEGEKDVEAVRTLGWTATCNVSGAGKWIPAYSDTLKGKDVIIIPDNDQVGQKHASDILASLTDKASSVKVVPMPSPYKDASDFIGSFSSSELAANGLRELFERTPHSVKPLPVMTIAELEQLYRNSLTEIAERSFDLGKFLPTLGIAVRPLIPGELVLIEAPTSTGKTFLIQALARAAHPHPTLLFELELPGTLLFERFAQMELGCTHDHVEQEYRDTTVPLWKVLYKKLSHIMVCAESGITLDQIESFIYRSELKFGKKPLVVLVDYVGLVKSPMSKSRYERLSDVAEQMKVIAKRTGTIIIMASQVSRKSKDGKGSDEVGLHDAKDSGSLENSAGLVLGVWRGAGGRLNIKILKNTRGRIGRVLECDFNGSTMQITEVPPSQNTELQNKKAVPNVLPLEHDT